MCTTTSMSFRCLALPAQCRLNLVLPGHRAFGRFKDPPVPLAFATTYHSAVSIPINGRCNVHSSVARNTLRPSTSHLRRVFACPPSLGPTPPVIVSNITRLGNHLSVWRATVPAKKSRHSRMVVLKPSHRVCWTYSHHCQIADKNPSKRWNGEFRGFCVCIGWISTTRFFVVGFYVHD